MPENRAAPRRKFTEDHDVALLKEVIACGVHISRRGSQMDKFEEVSAALNNGGAFPWMTDAKYCLERYKLLLSTFRRLDRVRASAPGAREFNENDQLLYDISVAVDDANERGRSDRLEQAKQAGENSISGTAGVRSSGREARSTRRQTSRTYIQSKRSAATTTAR
jgi:hypothetical protein